MRLRPELLLLVAFGCAPARTPVTPAARPASLDDAGIALVAQLLAMQDRRVLDSALVSRALAHPRPELRVQAALAAGRTGDLAAVPALRGATRDHVDDVAATAAFALGELGDSSATTIELLAALAAPAGWPRPVIAAEAAHALGKTMQQSAYAALYPALAGDAPAIVLHEALLAVWHHSPRWPAAVTAVQTHLTAADPETRWRAAYALMRMAAPASIGAQRGALTDADPRVRASAARGLRAASVDSAGAREPTRAALRAALSDSASH
ncbi:MAG: HEAT repeat domain-containing protein, partial [Longimicrobiales bacterium]